MSKYAVQQKVNNLWYGENKLANMLTPLSALYALVSRLKSKTQARDALTFTVPIIVVGNITVGGTGKTPMVATLAKELIEHGFHVGVATRGYKRKSTEMILVTNSHDVQDIGDEPLLIFQQSNAKVLVGNDRVRVIDTLIEVHSCNLVICDDGLQDYRFKHTVEVVMVDGDRIFGNQKLLPAGPLREDISRIDSADFIVATSKIIPALSSDCMKLGLNYVINLQSKAQHLIHKWTGKTVHAVAGIANPQRFFDALRSKGVNVIEHPYNDHANLSYHDLTFNDNHPIFMTEKDAVKCQHMNIDNLWYLPVEVELPSNFVSRIIKQVHES